MRKDIGDSTKYVLRMPPEYAGRRLDQIVPALLPQISRAAAADLIERSLVLVNDRPCKPATRLATDATIEVTLPAPPPSEAVPEDIPLHIVYEDQAIVVVDKPAGMVVHPAPGNQTGTLVNALLGRYAHLPGDSLRPGIVHRLDKDTSGLMVVARTPEAVSALAGAFKRRDVHKEYLALIVGTMDPLEGAINAAIGRDPRHRQRMAVLATGGRDARTTYATEERFKHYSLIRIVLETGRMHQIRVHFSALGHPVAGDPVYGHPIRGLQLRRQFLHSALLRFRHPSTGELLEFTSVLPAELAAIVERL